MIVVKYTLIVVIKAYQAVFSPQTGLLRFLYASPLITLSGQSGQGCRFRPTCSQYTIDALGRYPFLRALRLSIGRIGRCHSFYKGNYHNPVD